MKKLPDQYDSAILGVVQRCGEDPFVVYDEDKLVQAVIDFDGMDFDDAREHVEINMVQAWVGKDGPGYVMDYELHLNMVEMMGDEHD